MLLCMKSPTTVWLENQMDRDVLALTCHQVDIAFNPPDVHKICKPVCEQCCSQNSCVCMFVWWKSSVCATLKDSYTCKHFILGSVKITGKIWTRATQVTLLARGNGKEKQTKKSIAARERTEGWHHCWCYWIPPIPGAQVEHVAYLWCVPILLW